jgi:hypothetical protein
MNSPRKRVHYYKITFEEGLELRTLVLIFLEISFLELALLELPLIEASS